MLLLQNYTHNIRDRQKKKGGNRQKERERESQNADLRKTEAADTGLKKETENISRTFVGKKGLVRMHETILFCENYTNVPVSANKLISLTRLSKVMYLATYAVVPVGFLLL